MAELDVIAKGNTVSLSALVAGPFVVADLSLR